MYKLLGRTVRRKNNLFLLELEVIEYIVKYFLRFIFVCEKLYVIDKQHIDVIKFFKHIGKLIPFDCSHYFIDKFAGWQIDNYLFWKSCHNIITDRLHQMRFSKSYTSIQKQRIICLSRFSSNSFCSGKSDIIGCPDYKGIKRKFWIKKNSKKFRKFMLECSIFWGHFRLLYFFDIQKFFEIDKQIIVTRKLGIYDKFYRKMWIIYFIDRFFEWFTKKFLYLSKDKLVGNTENNYFIIFIQIQNSDFTQKR